MKKLLKFYEKARDNIFMGILYIFIFIIFLAIGGYFLRFNPIMKFIGLGIIVADLYYLLYIPSIKIKK